MNTISKREIEELKQKVVDIKESLSIDSKKEILVSLEQESRKENLWDDNKHAQDVLSQISDIKGEIEGITKIEEEVGALLSLIQDSQENEQET